MATPPLPDAPSARRAWIAEPQTPDFNHIFREQFAYAWHALRRLGVRENDLEDVTHDLFFTLHRQLAEYDPRRPIRPWIFAFAVRIASGYRRLARHRVDLVEDIGAVADSSASADAALDEHEARETVLRALDRLVWERRVIFVMHEIDEIPIPECAETLNIPLNTAYSRLRLARHDFEGAVRSLLRAPARPR